MEWGRTEGAREQRVGVIDGMMEGGSEERGRDAGEMG